MLSRFSEQMVSYFVLFLFGMTFGYKSIVCSKEFLGFSNLFMLVFFFYTG